MSIIPYHFNFYYFGLLTSEDLLLCLLSVLTHWKVNCAMLQTEQKIPYIHSVFSTYKVQWLYLGKIHSTDRERMKLKTQWISMVAKTRKIRSSFRNKLYFRFLFTWANFMCLFAVLVFKAVQLYHLLTKWRQRASIYLNSGVISSRNWPGILLISNQIYVFGCFAGVTSSITLIANTYYNFNTDVAPV